MMKRIFGMIALLLAAMMVMTLTAACGTEKKDEGSAQTASTQAAQDNAQDNAVKGAEQTWGEITIFVPDSMNMQGGDGSVDPDDQKTVWLTDKDNAYSYIKVMIYDSADDVKVSIDTTKEINKEYNPEDVKMTVGGTEWNGVAYVAMNTDCSSLYATVGDKVYFLMIGGQKYDSDIVKAILASLK